MKTKMKKKSVLVVMVIGLLAFGGSSRLLAQVASSTGSTTLNVKLTPMLNISVNDPNVDFDFDGVDDYTNGVTQEKDNHLTINCTTPFHLNVKSSGDLTNTADSKTLPISDIKLSAVSGTTGVMTDLSDLAVNKPLTNADQLILTSANATPNGTVKITYKAILESSDFALLDYSTADGVQTFSATLTYTIVAD